MADKIEVVVNVNDFETPMTPVIHTAHVCRKMIEAGVPISISGEIHMGRIYRLDDPGDFSLCRYVWEA